VTRRRKHPDGGFTLLELLVVSMLMTLVALMTAQMWRYFSAESRNLTDRTAAAQELRLAIESIRQDMGNVLWASPMSGDRLLIARPDGGAEERILVYSIQEGKLVRYDPVTGAEMPVAVGVAGFSAEDLTESVLRLEVTVQRGRITRNATMLWSRP